MNKYETVFIVDPDVTEPDQEAIIDRIRSQISRDNGRLVLFDDWGVRKFAYEIQKKKQGRYIRIEYAGSGELVHAIERIFRMDYRVIKFMTIHMEKNVDPDSLPADEPETSLSSTVTAETPPAETDAAANETAETAETQKPAETTMEGETESESEAKES